MAGGEPGLQFSLCILPRLKHPVTISSNRSQNQHIKPDWEIVLVLGQQEKRTEHSRLLIQKVLGQEAFSLLVK